MKPRILIVDNDKEIFLDPIVDALNILKKYKIYKATNSDDAFKILKSKKIDILVVDYDLANGQYNGDEIIRIIRQGEKDGSQEKALPCILITAYYEKIKPEFMNLMASFLTKTPNIHVELPLKIDEVLHANIREDSKMKWFSRDVRIGLIFPLLVLFIWATAQYAIPWVKGRLVKKMIVRVVSTEGISIPDAALITDGLAGQSLTDD